MNLNEEQSERLGVLVGEFLKNLNLFMEKEFGVYNTSFEDLNHFAFKLFSATEKQLNKRS